MDSNYSLADIAAATGNDRDNNMGGSWAWMLILLFLFWGFAGRNSWGNNGASGFGTAASIQEILFGQQFQNLEARMTSLANGICDSTFALNNSILTEGRALQTLVSNCCCEINRNIDGVRYDNAMNTQKILDAISGNRMADMQNQINQLQLQAALCGVVRYPTAITFNGGASPFCGGGCGCGCGCGC